MSIIRLNLFDTTSLLTTTYLLEDSVESADAKTLTASSLSATIATAIPNVRSAAVDSTMNYVDSLSDNELVQMVERLESKSPELSKDFVEIKISDDRPNFLR